jgi:hypothetical protein
MDDLLSFQSPDVLWFDKAQGRFIDYHPRCAGRLFLKSTKCQRVQIRDFIKARERWQAFLKVRTLAKKKPLVELVETTAGLFGSKPAGFDRLNQRSPRL